MTKALKSKEQFLSGGGEMGERIRNFDWAKTPLGPPEKWEQSLKTCVRIMLTSSQPIWIGWGEDLIKLYNDPYKAIVGGKHPQALGQPASVVWKDIWKDIEPLLSRVMKKDEGTYVESQLLIMERNNYPEETYYTFSYTPIPGDKGGTAGMICANTDDTVRIINERALETLKDLGKLHYSEKSVDEIYSKAALILTNNNKDFPFAIFSEIDETKMEARAVAWAGDKKDYEIYPQVIDIQNPNENTANICKAINTNEIVISENNGRRPNAPKGFWPVPPKQFVHIPLKVSNKLPIAVLSIGLNPFREYDNTYRQFIQLLSDQLSLEINNIQILEEERKRAAALAEIDKAKTVFFNNISHEFRTPLTLMLGPLEELLQQPASEINQRNLSGISTAHRNAMRLLKLVNTLLDFSRLESGRQQAFFSLVDIADYTKDLASSFRSVIEKAGLDLIVNAEENMPSVYIDKQMWEKIVFNLLSNAFKYTLNGSITVKIFSEKNGAVLQVIDTGIGIPEKELPHMFERFHRVEGGLGRTYEGTGIGLSMIKELASLNGGTISVESKEGKGSIFTVSIPIGKDHLSAEQVRHIGSDIQNSISNLYVEEASMLLKETPQSQRSENKNDKAKAKVLIVDDNADMREYIASLLENNYDVITANNGAVAYEKIKAQQPSLVLSDIMMPVMDGIELLKKIKQDPVITNLPVILLSARAEEESKIKGYDIGADDYLTKPFSSKELISRVSAQLTIAKKRQHTEQQLKNLFLQAPVALCIFRGPYYIVEVANNSMLEFWGKTADQVMNKPIFEGLPDAKNQGFEELLDSVYKTGKRFVAPESPVRLFRKGKMEQAFVKFVYEPLYEEDGSISGIMALADEITEQVMSRQKIEESEEKFRALSDSLDKQVKERTNELEHKNVVLEKVNKELQSFTYISSHDLQEPLRKIQTFSSRIVEKENANLSEDGKYKFGRIQVAAKRMQALIEDLLAYSRTTSADKKMEETDLMQIIEEVKTDLKEELQLKNARIEATDMPIVKIIPFQFRQLLQNLIGNSLKFSKEGQWPIITIKSSFENKVRPDGITPGKEEKFCHISVSDNGIGFEQKYNEKIFEVFQRLHGKEQYIGTGVGLAIVKKIVENHNGFITAKSKLNEGATFDIYIPAGEM